MNATDGTGASQISILIAMLEISGLLIFMDRDTANLSEFKWSVTLCSTRHFFSFFFLNHSNRRFNLPSVFTQLKFLCGLQDFYGFDIYLKRT